MNGGPRAEHQADEPSVTVSPNFDGRARWVHERPATTVVGGRGAEVISAPGWHDGVSRQDAEGGVRVTVEEAAVLQGFRRDYPWQGSRADKHRCIGNAVCPPLACAVIGELLGLDWRTALGYTR